MKLYHPCATINGHHGSKAIIKQSSPCASTRHLQHGSTISKGYIIMSSTITKGYIIMGSTTSSGSSKDNRKPSSPSKGSSSMYVGHLHVQSPSEDHHQRHHHHPCIHHQGTTGTIIIQVASYCDHCKGHTSSSSGTRLPTSVVGIKDKSTIWCWHQ